MTGPWSNTMRKMTLKHSRERNFPITPAARGRCLRTGLVAGRFGWLQHPNRSKPSLSESRVAAQFGRDNRRAVQVAECVSREDTSYGAGKTILRQQQTHSPSHQNATTVNYAL